MAGALRKVSEDYNWTIKRADNDLRHNITSPLYESPATPGSPRPPPRASPSFLDLSVSPWDQWDSDRLQWKLRTDYEELCEHLEQIYLILFGWAMTLNYLRTVASKDFVSDPIRYVSSLYEESGKLARLGIHPTSESIWGLTVAVFRFAAPFIVSLLSDIFGVYLQLHAKATGDKTDATPVSRLAENPVVVEPVKEKAPSVSNDMQAPVKDNPSNDTSDAAPKAAPLLPSPSLTPDPKGRSKTIQTVMHDETGRFSLRKSHTESHDARSNTGLIKRENLNTDGPQRPKSPKPASRGKSRRREAKVVRTRHRSEDLFGMGDASGSVIAYDPGSLAL